MNEKINVASLTVNGDWCNLKTREGKEISVNLVSNPKLKIHLGEGKIPDVELTANVVEKNGKFYGWDPKEEKQGGGGFKKETPEEREARLALEAHKQRMIVAQSSLGYATNFYAQRSAGDWNAVKEMAGNMYNWVMETSK